MQEFRCKKCGRLLAMEDIRQGELEIKCKYCKTFNVIRIQSLDKIGKVWNNEVDK